MAAVHRVRCAVSCHGGETQKWNKRQPFVAFMLKMTLSHPPPPPNNLEHQKLTCSGADIVISFRAHTYKQFSNTVPHASSNGNHRLQIFLTTRDDRSFTTETAKHSLELDPNVVMGGIHISECGCNARLQSHDTDDQLKAVVETDVSLHTSDDRLRANVYSFQRKGCCPLVRWLHKHNNSLYS